MKPYENKEIKQLIKDVEDIKALFYALPEPTELYTEYHRAFSQVQFDLQEATYKLKEAFMALKE